jgi:UDP-N-acetylmuramate dehydrogenase
VDVAEQVPLAPLTTLRLGGPARRLVEATTTGEVIEAVREADRAGGPALVLSGGSNVVIADAGFDGTVVRLTSHGVSRKAGDDGRTHLTVEAGAPWDEVVASAVADGLAGIEALSGIPGSTGATPIQNVGAYGQEVAETIVRVRVYDRVTGAIGDIPAGICGFAYRTSAFKGNDRHVVLEVEFALTPSASGMPIRYAELARALGVLPGERAPLADVRAAVLGLRRGKGMVVDPADPDSVSAGSFFTNPILTPAKLEEIAAGAGETPPSWPQPDGSVKASAAWLIERSGFSRGYERGPVAISSKHTLALVNRGGAAAADLVALAREVAGGVDQRFGVKLVPEPVFVGHSW